METVITDSDTLRITVTHGDTDIAVVAFSGIGLQLDQIPQEEFVTTLRGAAHSQFFIVDKQRSWYNATALEIVATLTPLLTRYRKVVTLGNSMGGFGAVYFASRFPNISTAISFSPQFSVDATIVPTEKRWHTYRSRITKWTVRYAMERARNEPELLLFFGRTHEADDRHRELFQEHATERTAIVALRDAKHGTARYLKRHDLLRAVLDTIILDEAGASGVTNLLTQSGVSHVLWTPSAAVA